MLGYIPDVMLAEGVLDVDQVGNDSVRDAREGCVRRLADRVGSHLH